MRSFFVRGGLVGVRRKLRFGVWQSCLKFKFLYFGYDFHKLAKTLPPETITTAVTTIPLFATKTTNPRLFKRNSKTYSVAKKTQKTKQKIKKQPKHAASTKKPPNQSTQSKTNASSLGSASPSQSSPPAAAILFCQMFISLFCRL